MSKLDQAIRDLLDIEGATGAAIVDVDSGMALASGGAPGFDLTVAAAGNANVIRAKMRTMADLGIQEAIEDILISLSTQYHLINVLDSANRGLALYLVLNRATSNLALARHKLRSLASEISV